MAIGRRSGGAPRWMWVYAIVCAAALLLTLTVIYLMTVHVRTTIARFMRSGLAASRPVHGIPYAELINRAAAAHRLSPALLAAVVVAESGFDPHARSSRGAYGLMQVMPVTWREIRPAPACPPEIARRTAPPCMEDAAANLDVGATYLHRLVEQFGGNVALAVAAYNAGAGMVAHHRGVPPFPETNRYLRQVALAWFHLQQDGTLTPFWLTVIRSFDLWQRARAAFLVAFGARALPWLWRWPRPAPVWETHG